MLATKSGNTRLEQHLPRAILGCGTCLVHSLVPLGRVMLKIFTHSLWMIKEEKIFYKAFWVDEVYRAEINHLSVDTEVKHRGRGLWFGGTDFPRRMSDVCVCVYMYAHVYRPALA